MYKNELKKGLGKSSILFMVIMLGVFFSGCKDDSSEIDNSPFWELQEIGSTASLRGVFAVSDQVIWASGSSGTYVRTIDGGDRWYVNTYPDQPNSMDYRDVHAFDENSAILLKIASPAVILKTRNSGMSWNRRYFRDDKTVFFNSMDFWDKDNGIIVGDPIEGRFQMLLTDDKGETWYEIPPERIPPAEQGEMQFAASGTCLAVSGSEKVWIGTGGSNARIFFSGDRGTTWEVFDTPIVDGEGSKGIFSVAFYNENKGIIVGGDYREDYSRTGNCALTYDGGRTWKLVEGENSPYGFRSCVAYIPNTGGNALIAVGTSGTDISEDGGMSWTNVDTTGYNSISIDPNGRTAWAVGADGRIARSSLPNPGKYRN